MLLTMKSECEIEVQFQAFLPAVPQASKQWSLQTQPRLSYAMPFNVYINNTPVQAS